MIKTIEKKFHAPPRDTDDLKSTKRNLVEKVFLVIISFSLSIFVLICVIYKFFPKVGNVFGLNTFITIISKESVWYPKESVYPHFYELRPDFVELVHPIWLPYEARYTYNHDGLNERYNYPVEKKTGVTRIMTLGDSFTFGAYVNTQDSYPEKLEDKLTRSSCGGKNSSEVINLGVSGYDISFAVERFRLRGAKYNPDIIIWLITPQNILKIQEMHAALQEQIAATLSAQEIQRGQKNRQYYVASQQAEQILYKKYSQDWFLNFQRDQLKKFNSLFGGTLVIVQFHDTEDAIKAFIQTYADERPNTYVMDTLVLPVLPNAWQPDGHPNAVGYKIIADSIYTYLQANKLISCP